MPITIPDKPTRTCCGNSMYFEWGGPDSQWDRGYLTSWHCHTCGCNELATRQEIRQMMDHEEAVFNHQMTQQPDPYKGSIQQIPKPD